MDVFTRRTGDRARAFAQPILLALCSMTCFGQIPKITAVVSAASFNSYQVASGAYVSIFGSNLADQTYQSPDANYKTKLGSTEVLVCETSPPTPAARGVLGGTCSAAVVQYASPGQINVVLPSLSSGQKFIVARVNGLLDADAEAFNPTGKAFTANVLSFSPAPFLAGRDCPIDSVPASGGGPRWTGVNQNCGIFPQEPIPGPPSGPLIHPSRANRGIVTDLSGKLIWSGNPARLGQFYTVWLTGLGKITNGISAPINVGVADVPAYGYPNPTVGSFRVTYTGAVPQFPGLYQINFQVPLEIGTGPLGYGAWPCGDYSWELSLNVIQGSGFASQSASILDFPLVIRNGDVACKP